MLSDAPMGKSSDGRSRWECTWLLMRPWERRATEGAGGRGGFWSVHEKEKQRKERKGEWRVLGEHGKGNDGKNGWTVAGFWRDCGKAKERKIQISKEIKSWEARRE